MISYKEAQEILLRHARPFGQEKIGLEDAYGRVLAETIFADRDYPPFNRSSMDGFAMRTGDLQKGIRRFTVVETIFAGATHTKPLGPGECYKIMTGAPVPDEADIVIRREDTVEGAVTIDLLPPPAPPFTPNLPAANPVQHPEPQHLANPATPPPVHNHPVANPDAPLAANPPPTSSPNWRPFANIARKGEDLRSGSIVIDRPAICEPAMMGLLASLGKKEVLVQRQPRVALLTTGNEVVAVDAPVLPGQIRNSNRWLLQGFLQKNGLTPSLYAHLPDDIPAMRNALEKALTADIIILTGGVSAGDADYVPGVLEELGVKRLFHKIAMKPGKPAWCGLAPGGGTVFALPGNPFSCLVGFVLLIQPFLDACRGLPVPQPLSLPLQTAKKKRTPLDEFFPVQPEGTPAGLRQMTLNGSGDIRMGLYASALALHPAEMGDLPVGSEVRYYSFV